MQERKIVTNFHITKTDRDRLNDMSKTLDIPVAKLLRREIKHKKITVALSKKLVELMEANMLNEGIYS